VGVGRHVIAKIECGGGAPAEVVRGVAKVFGVPENVLCGYPACDFKTLFRLLRDWEHAECVREKEYQTDLHLDLLFIDLVEGWDFLMKIAQAAKSTRIHFRILMLDGPAARLNLSEPSDVIRNTTLEWSNTAAVRCEAVIANFRRNLFAQLDPPKVVSAKLCVYGVVPTLHGVRVRKGESVRVAVGRCAVPPDLPLTYTWADEHTLYVSEVPDFDEQTREWRERFDELWDAGEVKHDSATDRHE
jgi:hypothetical protein